MLASTDGLAVPIFRKEFNQRLCPCLKYLEAHMFPMQFLLFVLACSSGYCIDSYP